MKPIQSISRVLLHTRAVDAITEYIRENELSPGDRLPSERAIAEQLGIGRNSLREALRILESHGAIRVKNGLGIFVGEMRDGSGIDLRVNHERVNLLELLDIRYALERRAIELCIKHASDEDIRRAEPALRNMEALAIQTAINASQIQEEDRRYHSAVYRGAQNGALRDLLLQIDEMSVSYWDVLEGHSELFVATLPAHRDQYEALLGRNVKKAAEATNSLLRIDADHIMKAQAKTGVFIMSSVYE